MTAISANLVKDLREKTGAGMMDCKRALTETAGDFEAAIDWLRAKGLSAAAKKAGRVAAEGLVAAVVEGKNGVAVEVNSETDFVALNDKFQALVSEIAKLALGANDIEELKTIKTASGKNVEESVVEAVATIGENISLRRSARLSVNNGVIASYLHNVVTGNLGKIAVLVALESTGDATKLNTLGRQIAMHIAAAKPVALDQSGVDFELVEREKSIFVEQSKASGKPDNIIEKMVEGRIRKFYEEIVLLEQVFVIDGKTRIKEVIENASKDIGASIVLKDFVRFELGEGIEQEETDFAAEVAAVSGVK
jgi:elongation factor Ts